jgi:hypothetical protein
MWCFFLVASGLMAAVVHDPTGFRVDLPPGWQATKSGAGHIVMAGPNPQTYAFVRPVLNRNGACDATLRQNISGATGLEIAPAGPRMATARFLFQGGQVRGAMLCAETSRRTAMLYGYAAPKNEFAQQAPRLMAILRSFAFEGLANGQGGSATAAAVPPLSVAWQEPHEMAYTLAIPQGWRAMGGVRRLDVTHYNNGVQLLSPDGGSVIRIGDQRLAQCTVPGPGAASMPSTGGLNYCQMQSAGQFGNSYLRMMAQDFGWRDGRVTGVQERPDLAQRAQAVPASFGLRTGVSVAEIRFQASWNGNPVTGALLATTTMFYAVQGQNFILGTQSFEVVGYAGPAAQAGMLARLTGAIRASQRINPAWWSQTQQINRQVAERTLATLHAEAAHQQETAWNRMAAADRRTESVGHLLSGTVELSDGQGNRYQAKAGSNYYFLDTEAAKTAGRPDDAVRGGDVWPSPMVDLRPLEVVR